MSRCKHCFLFLNLYIFKCKRNFCQLPDDCFARSMKLGVANLATPSSKSFATPTDLAYRFKYTHRAIQYITKMLVKD